MCCGLTWISTGQLSKAKRVLRRTLRVVRPYLDAGVPIVGLEPSCAAALGSDMPELLPDHTDAARLAGRVQTLAAFLTTRAPDWSPPRLERRAIIQPHCHQYAVLGTEPERKLMTRLGMEAKTLTGCCGLAGNTGFERGNYPISKAVAEQRLLPSIREAAPDTLVLADGFSCRTQIGQETGRGSLHLAQLLHRALNQAPGKRRPRKRRVATRSDRHPQRPCTAPQLIEALDLPADDGAVDRSPPPIHMTVVVRGGSCPVAGAMWCVRARARIAKSSWRCLPVHRVTLCARASTSSCGVEYLAPASLRLGS